MVLDRNWWYYNTNHIVGYHNDARKSYYRKRSPLNEIGIAIQVFQIAYVVITAIIIVKEMRANGKTRKIV